MIQVRIRKAFPARAGAAFSLEIEFALERGAAALMGPPGAGKTLVLDAIAGLLKPDAGRILAGDQILFDADAGVNLPPRRRSCGYVLGRHALLPHMTVRENVAFAAACRGLPKLERHRHTSELLERFQLAEFSARKPAEVSELVRQRCAVARAVAGGPGLLLVDEPPAVLEASARSLRYELARRAGLELGVPVLYATREMEDCLDWADTVLVVENGRLLQSGSPRQVFENPACAAVARLIGGFNMLPAEITELNPVERTSRLRVAGGEVQGPYFPGRLLGDRVTLCVRYDELVAIPGGKPGPNRLAAPLDRVSERPEKTRLYFRNGVIIDMPRAEFDNHRHVREWLAGFPAENLRVF